MSSSSQASTLLLRNWNVLDDVGCWTLYNCILKLCVMCLVAFDWKRCRKGESKKSNISRSYQTFCTTINRRSKPLRRAWTIFNSVWIWNDYTWQIYIRLQTIYISFLSRTTNNNLLNDLHSDHISINGLVLKHSDNSLGVWFFFSVLIQHLWNWYF